MHKFALALAIAATATLIQIPLAFATLPQGCTGNPHDKESPTANPHDFTIFTTPSGSVKITEGGNPHDIISFHHGERFDEPGHFGCPGAQ